MDEDEMEEILYRLDERTKRVDEKLELLDRRTRATQERAEKLRLRVQSNEEDLKRGKGVLAIIGMGLSGLVAKLMGLFHL